MSEQYYYATNGKRNGPIPFAALRELATKGELKRTDTVWWQGVKEERQAGSLESFLATCRPIWTLIRWRTHCRVRRSSKSSIGRGRITSPLGPNPPRPQRPLWGHQLPHRHEAMIPEQLSVCLMRIFLTSCFIMCLLPPLFGGTNEPPEAFGIRIGQTTNGLDLKPLEKAGMFQVLPPVPNQMFTNYQVHITPKSGRVAEIFASFQKADEEVIFGLLWKKYDRNPRYGGLGAGHWHVYAFDGRANDQFNRILSYRDEDLISLCDREEKQIEQARVAAEIANTVPIDGAFGIVLGQSTEGLQLGKVVQKDRGSPWCIVTPPKPDSRLTNYQVELTPISKRVMSILATYHNQDEDAIWKDLLTAYGQRNADNYRITTGERPPAQRDIGDKYRSVELFKSLRRPGADETGQICYTDHGKEILAEFDQFEKQQKEALIKKADKNGL